MQKKETPKWNLSGEVSIVYVFLFMSNDRCPIYLTTVSGVNLSSVPMLNDRCPVPQI